MFGSTTLMVKDGKYHSGMMKKGYYEGRRKESKEDYDNNSMWDFQYEPMVLLPTDEFPKWGDGVRLKYDFEEV